MHPTLISFFKNAHVPAIRSSMFIVFFWFGILKVLGLSPASGLVERLFNETVPFMAFSTFLICFGIFECIIGILFLIKGAEKIALSFLAVHMFTTFGPLVFLPSETWSGFLVPTLEGQYILKNVVLIAAGISLGANLIPKAVPSELK